MDIFTKELYFAPRLTVTWRWQMPILESFCNKGGWLEMVQFSEVDAKPLFELIDSNREHLSQFGDNTSAKYPTLESVRKSIIAPVNPARLRFGIWRRGELLGTINLTPGKNPGQGVVGYWVGRQYRKQYVGSGALKSLVNYARMRSHSLNLKVLLAETHKENIASHYVLWQAGFKAECTIQNTVHWMLEL